MPSFIRNGNNKKVNTVPAMTRNEGFRFRDQSNETTSSGDQIQKRRSFPFDRISNNENEAMTSGYIPNPTTDLSEDELAPATASKNPDPLDLDAFMSSDEESEPLGLLTSEGPAILTESIQTEDRQIRIFMAGTTPSLRPIRIENTTKKVVTDQDGAPPSKTSCHLCATAALNHDPDVCIAARTATVPEAVADATNWGMPQSLHPEDKRYIATNVQVTFENPGAVNFCATEILLPVKSSVAEVRSHFERGATKKYESADTVIRSWPGTPPGFSIRKEAWKHVKASKPTIASRDRPKQDLGLLYLTFLEARELYRLFFEKISMLNPAATMDLSRVDKQFDEYPRREWVSADSRGVVIWGTGTKFIDLIYLRNLLFSSRTPVVAKAKCMLVSNLGDHLREAMIDPLKYFELSILKTAMTANEIASLFYDFDEDGRMVDPAKRVCLVCDSPVCERVIGKRLEIEHKEDCPIMKYLRRKWKYKERTDMTVLPQWLRAFGNLKKHVVKEHVMCKGDRVLTYDESGKIVSVRQVQQSRD